MKKTINYEKDILFKTNIGEICSISLEHDFTVDSGCLKGDFILSGEYKTNELCLNKEKFEYRLPLEYELEDDVDLSTLSYDIDNFEYNVDGDSLGVIIDFGVRYEEIKPEPIIPEIDEVEINEDPVDTLDDLPRFKDEEPIVEEPVEEPKVEEEENRLNPEEKDVIISSSLEQEGYMTYHVHIIREGDTLESIASKYGCSVELIKEYNNTESLELKSKLIIPDVKDE